jgi:tetratricopeptide (TPR) repeat protein
MDIIRMKTSVLVAILAVMAAFTLNCSSGSQDTREPAANTDPAAETSVANITDPNVALAEGSRLLDENQTERAIGYLEHAVSLNADLAEAYFKLGVAYSLLEMQYEQEGVITEKPSTNNGGRTKSRSEKAFERAVKAYEKWIDANPDDDGAYYYLGRTYSKLMKDEEAEKAFKQAVKIKSEDTEYQTELGAILIKLAKYHEAIAPLKKAIELDPENVRAEELLEDAEAGRQRIDYVSKPDANKATPKPPSSNVQTESNTNAAANTKLSNSNARPPVNLQRKATPSVVNRVN